jgi:drug/metabolite transporter (DMT)-like permease
MASTAGESITPGYATSARPGVWLTDLSLIFVAFVWGVNFSIVKFGTTLVAPLAYNGLRIALAAVVLSIIVAAGRAPLPSGPTIAALLALGVLGNGIYQFLFIEGIAHTRASDAALVVAASPAFIAMIGRAKGIERISRRGSLGIALSIAGITLVVFGTSRGAEGRASLLGDALVLAGSLAWAFYTVMLKPYTHRVPGMQLSAFTMIGGALALLVVASPAIVHAPWASMPLVGWASVFFSGMLALVVAYYFWYRAVRIIGPTRTAMYSNLQPLFAVAMAWAMLGERPTIWQAVGAVTIMTGLVLTRT